MLLRHDAKVEYIGNPPAIIAHNAASSGNVEVLQLLLDNGMTNRLVPQSGDGVCIDDGEPLVISSLNQPNVLRLLIESGASLNIRNSLGQTPLMIIVQNGNRESFSILMEDPYQIDELDMNGRTALMFASQGTYEEIVRSLLVAEAKTQIRDNEENTPLHYAAQSSIPEIVRLLLTAGAEINASNTIGKLPINLAGKNPRSAEIIAILEAAGATIPADTDKSGTNDTDEVELDGNSD